MSTKRHAEYKWDAKSIRALRQYMSLSQQQMSERLGIRQQTVSEWETGMYEPRGGMCTLLTMVAERAGFKPTYLSESEAPNWHAHPLYQLNLKPRALKALRQAGIETVSQALEQLAKGEDTLLDIPDFGQRSLEKLKQALRKHGLIY
ncbi:MAG: helix-turn-helix domain-containing protein [Anaerolineae bacterium]|nr:helix-turn-helix domain-containing protein [Anaerolineae bacterium]